MAVQLGQQPVRRSEGLRLVVEADQRRRVLDHPAGTGTPGVGSQPGAPQPKPHRCGPLGRAGGSPDFARLESDRRVGWATLQKTEGQVEIQWEGEGPRFGSSARHRATLTRNARA